MAETLVERIDAAMKRISDGLAPMRIPVDQTDPDVVLGDCKTRIEELERQLASARQALDDEIDSHIASRKLLRERAEIAESQLATARQDERERCAKVCERSDKSTHPSDLAAALRALPDKEGL